MRIHLLLQKGRHPNSAKLARELEVSTRTIKRDIDFMKCRLNLPIEYDARRYGFYYSNPVDQFPTVPITEAEIFALLVAQKAIAQYRGTPFQQPLDAAFRKMTAGLDRNDRFTLDNFEAGLSFRPFAPEDADLQNFQLLSQALRESRAIRFQYRKLGTKRARRRHAHPHHLACIDNHWYLFAFDVDRQAMRTFVLARLSRPELTGERFVRQQDFNADEYLRGSFTVFKGREDFEIVIDFDAWAADLVRGRRWHPTQEWIALPNGCARLRMRLNNVEEMEQWVLSWGAHATVVRPAELVERVRVTARKLAERYTTRGGDEKTARKKATETDFFRGG